MHCSIIIPTIREEHINSFLEAWKPQLKGHRVIVIEDHYFAEFSLPRWVEHYSHFNIEAELGEDEWIISRKSSSVRNFGTYKAMQKKTDMIWHLDDDCLPITGNELQGHFDNLYTNESVNKWQSTDKFNNHMRGMPYYNREATVNIVVSHGTWLGNPDYDAAHQLASRFEFEPIDGVVGIDTYFSMCGMNLAFKPEVAIAMYFAPSGPEQPYDRIDDIWMGVIAKRALDHFRLRCLTGYPQINHTRASNSFKNMIAEAPGMEPNETFWQYIDAMDCHTNSNTLTSVIRHIARNMIRQPFLNQQYFRDYGYALMTWAERITDA